MQDIEDTKDTTGHSHNKLFYTLVRVPKSESAFFYFQLEANENLAFYYTLKHRTGAAYRDVAILSPWCFKEEVNDLLKRLADAPVELEIIEQKEVPDGAECINIVSGL